MAANNYTYKKGTFTVTSNHIISFFDVNGTYMGDAPHSWTDQNFVAKATANGFNKEGCWAYRAIEDVDGYAYAKKGLYLFSCQSGSNKYRFNMKIDALKNISYVYIK